MPVITRDDGVQFAVYTYRELLTAKKPSFLKQEIQMLQKENGDYCRFFTQPTGDFESVFSREEGYLLAETVWDHFDKPFDFIYCEALEDGENAILVVVRAGSIYLDAKVGIETLADEFAGLVTGINEYDIYISGDVPLSETEEEGKFTFEDSFVKSFTELDEPLFPILTVNPAYKLIPVPQAVDELQIGKEKLPIYVVIIVLAVALGFAYWILKPEREEPVYVPVISKPPPVDPYADYKSDLSTPAPSEQLKEISLDTRQLFTMPGWVPTKISFDNETITVSLESIGGTTEMLLAWIRANDIELRIKDNRAELLLPITAKKRQPPKVIYNVSDLISTVIDRVKQTVPQDSIAIVDSVEMENYILTSMEITFSDVTTDIIMLFGQELKNLPAVLEGGEFSVDDGLLTGKIRIQIVGATS